MSATPIPPLTPKSCDEVLLYHGPWVKGARALDYFGMLEVERFLPDEGRTDDSLEGALEEVCASMQYKAFSLGANAVVGVELTLDPFAREGEHAEGLRLHLNGTAAKLGKLL